MIATGFTVSSLGRHFAQLTCVCLAIMASGCATEDDTPGGAHYPDQRDDSAAISHTPSSGIGCEEGLVRACEIVVGVHNGIKSCAIGKSFCIEGRWSACALDEA